MTPDDLQQQLVAYATGLEAELSLLRQVQRFSAAQRHAHAEHDIEEMQRISDERDRVMAGLVRIEHEISEMRRVLSEHKEQASRVGGFAEVVALHRVAADLVAEIISSDRETMTALRDAEIARREAAHALDAGENTLAAYRRVLSPTLSGPSLVSRRG